MTTLNSYFTWFLPHQEQGIFFLCLLFFFAEFFLCSSLQWCHINAQYSLPWIFTYWSQRQCNLLSVRLSLFPLLPSHASSSYFDLKESCSRSRTIPLAIYTILFQSWSMWEERFLFMTEDDIHYYYFLSVQTSHSFWILSSCQGQLPSPNTSSTSGAFLCLW